jgi:hypothetical protein
VVMQDIADVIAWDGGGAVRIVLILKSAWGSIYDEPFLGFLLFWFSVEIHY